MIGVADFTETSRVWSNYAQIKERHIYKGSQRRPIYTPWYEVDQFLSDDLISKHLMTQMNIDRPSPCLLEDPYTGSIELIIGPMFSGKTTELIRRVRRHSLAKRKCLVIKFAADTRYSDEQLSTHDKHMIPALKCRKLSEAVPFVSGYDVIGVDEGQFYPDLLEFCEQQANNGKIVIVSALDGTFERKRFNSVVDLIPLCESVVKLSAVCTICGATASFSMRTSSDKQVEIVGGSELYTAVCRKCYFENVRKSPPMTPKTPDTSVSPEINPSPGSPVRVLENL